MQVEAQPVRRRWVLPALLVSLCWGCAESPGPTGAGDAPPPGQEPAVGDPGDDVYHAGLERSGEAGRVMVRLIESDPIPQDTGLYTWTVLVQNLQGEPLAGAALSAEPTMPNHGHGTFPAVTEGTPMEEDGHFALADMDLFMAGLWDVTLTVVLPDGGLDTLTFHFRLEG